AQDGAIVRGAATATDQDGARHLMVLLGQNRAFTPRLLEKLQEIVLRLHPTALRDRRGQGDGGQVGGHEIYMTEGGLERLQAELEQLRNVEMPANRAEIARAREFGDLKENAEYHAAREKQGLLEAKSRQLESDVARAKILTADIVRTDAVSVGSQVDVRDTDGHVRTYTLLGPPDADPGRGILNYQTPLAQALMGQSRGDSSRIEIDGSVREVE
ncbi:MAG: transcription elongation factor GreA, partial [Myxococcales bacterium]|nr:transcription elongation factor GreA [Myxococcales bacterium]